MTTAPRATLLLLGLDLLNLGSLLLNLFIGVAVGECLVRFLPVHPCTHLLVMLPVSYLAL